MRMRVAFVTLSIAAHAAAVPQGVTSAVAPAQSPPSGCSPSYDGTFQISPVNVSKSKRDLEPRATPLGIALKNGILTDPQGRTGYIAGNEQFQFDDPPQAGALYTAGFSVCPNGTLALGHTAIWYECLSGSFYNLYYKDQGAQCIACFLHVVPQGDSSGPVPVSSSSTSSSSKTGTRTTGNINVGTSSTHTPNSSTATGTASSHKTSGDGLPSGAKIGIGVGVGVGVGCLLLALGSFFYFRRRYARSSPPEGHTISEKHESHEMRVRESPHELAAGRGPLPELPAKEKPQELPADRQ